METFRKTLRGHITPDDKERSDYATIPFDLPFVASRLTISYDYSARMTADRIEGGNVIDLGLFDPRGSQFPGGPGFRGWSGSARSEFFVGSEEATPGYLPGPLPSGRYAVLLGLYRIWAQGADYEIHIEAISAVDQTVASTVASVDASDELARTHSVHMERLNAGTAETRTHDQSAVWLRGDLQSHTYHSDAKGSPALLVSKARALGLDFLAITDHNTVSHHALLPDLADETLMLIPGQEVTTYYGHMNVWGTGHWCDFRSRSKDDIAGIIELAHGFGAVCSINHPKIGGPAWDYGFDLPVQAMEVWQGPWPYRNDQSLKLWDRLLCEGRHLPGVGGSDYHCPMGKETSLLRLGQPTTWVHVQERSVDGILAAICAGRACISAHPHGPRLDFHAAGQTDRAQIGGTLSISPNEEITLTISIINGAGYRLLVIADGSPIEERTVSTSPATMELAISASTYIRCELVADMPSEKLPQGVPDDVDLRDWRWALSNPIYLMIKA